MTSTVTMKSVFVESSNWSRIYLWAVTWKTKNIQRLTLYWRNINKWIIVKYLYSWDCLSVRLKTTHVSRLHYEKCCSVQWSEVSVLWADRYRTVLWNWKFWHMIFTNQKNDFYFEGDGVALVLFVCFIFCMVNLLFDLLWIFEIKYSH